MDIRRRRSLQYHSCERSDFHGEETLVQGIIGGVVMHHHDHALCCGAGGGGRGSAGKLRNGRGFRGPEVLVDRRQYLQLLWGLEFVDL